MKEQTLDNIRQILWCNGYHNISFINKESEYLYKLFNGVCFNKNGRVTFLAVVDWGRWPSEKSIHEFLGAKNIQAEVLAIQCRKVKEGIESSIKKYLPPPKVHEVVLEKKEDLDDDAMTSQF